MRAAGADLSSAVDRVRMRMRCVERGCGRALQMEPDKDKSEDGN